MSDPPIDAIRLLLSKCSPELVAYIFSFTTREHASAAGFFSLARSLTEQGSMCLDFHTIRSPIEYAVLNGDLPLVKYILSTPEPVPLHPWHFHRSIQVKSFSHGNIHVYRYLFLLIDIGQPLRVHTMVEKENVVMSLFDNLRQWATMNDRTDFLDFLFKTLYSRNLLLPYADWVQVIELRNMKLLQHAHDTHKFRHNDGIALQASLAKDWIEALTFLHSTCGIRFSTWTKTDLGHIHINRRARDAMAAATMAPDDMCKKCRDYWLPRLGYLGMVAVYERHRTEPAFHEACGSDDGDDIEVDLPLKFQNDLEGVLSDIARDAFRMGDIHTVRYLADHAPLFVPEFWAFFLAMRNRHAEVLRLLCEQYVEFARFMFALPQLVKNSLTRDLLKIASTKESADMYYVALMNQLRDIEVQGWFDRVTTVDVAVSSQGAEKGVEKRREMTRGINWEDVIARFNDYIGRLVVGKGVSEEDRALIDFWPDLRRHSDDD